jgi:hypothetical protein
MGELVALVLRTSEARSSGDNALNAPVYLSRAFSIVGLWRSALLWVATLFRVATPLSVAPLMASGAPLA